jgi:hypothetical protein
VTNVCHLQWNLIGEEREEEAAIIRVDTVGRVQGSIVNINTHRPDSYHTIGYPTISPWAQIYKCMGATLSYS